MSDISSVLLAVCGIGGVCCGAFLLAGFVLLRFVGGSVLTGGISALGGVLDYGGGLLGGLFGDDDKQRVEQDVEQGTSFSAERPVTHEAIEQRIRRAKQQSLDADPNVEPLNGIPEPRDRSGLQGGRSLRDRARRGRRGDYDDGEEVWGGAFDNDANDVPDMYE